MRKPSTPHRQQHGNSEGFSLPIAVLAGFLLLLGSLALASRSSWGLFGSAFQSRNWAARSAAETGMNIIVNELNRPQNRWLNVVRNNGIADPDYQKIQTADLWQNRNDSQRILELRQNPCVVTKSPPTPNETPDYSRLDPNNASSTSYGKWYISPDGKLSSSQGTANRSFRLARIIHQPYAGAIGIPPEDINKDNIIDERDRYLSVWRDRSTNPTGVGKVIIQVEGQTYQNGKVLASVILERTYELTPKCCGASFGGKHGNIDYTVQTEGADQGTTACLTQLGLGLLAGAKGNDTGSVTVRGRSSEVENELGDEVNPIYCLADNKAGCAISTTSSLIDVAVIDSKLPPVYTFCTPPQGADAYRPNNPCPSAPKGAFDESTFFNPISPLTNISCTTTNFACATTSRGKRFIFIKADSNLFPPYCRKTADDKELHCNISKIDISVSGNPDLFFITGGRKLFLYFEDSGPIINNNGNTVIRNCKSYDFTVNPDNCTTPADDTTSLSLFGSSTQDQSIKLFGTADLDNNMFIYFPSGSVQLTGTPSFQGVLWTNELTSIGTATWVIPRRGLTDVFELFGLTSGTRGEIEPLFYDFVLRATNQQRWLGG